MRNEFEHMSFFIDPNTLENSSPALVECFLAPVDAELAGEGCPEKLAVAVSMGPSSISWKKALSSAYFIEEVMQAQEGQVTGTGLLRLIVVPPPNLGTEPSGRNQALEGGAAEPFPCAHTRA